MRAPVNKLIRGFSRRGISRFCMPGHKGKRYTGCEKLDVTEVLGVTDAYTESERYATEIFGTAATLYSSEGSTLSIKAMLAILKKQKPEGRLTILAARNAHRAFLYGAAVLDADIIWLYPEEYTHLSACDITPKRLRTALTECDPTPDAVYVTSPDYLGNILDVKGLAEVCHEYSIPLLVDNAHGAYLRFLEPSLHPMDLGADMCADSAHKTLPVLTGGAYLHINKSAEHLVADAREAMTLFASTSPSHLIGASLDRCNSYLSGTYPKRLEKCIALIDKVKSRLQAHGCPTESSEPLKIVLDPRKYLYTGVGFSKILRKFKIEPEMVDDEYAVLMATPDNTLRDYLRLLLAMRYIRKNPELRELPELAPITPSAPARKMSAREAILAPHELISTDDALGRVVGAPTVSFPPCVPILVSGEVIGSAELELLKRYGITSVEVVRE
nr:aminotransferase class V-fold PLP-dependent enzyme [Clostridia bacterium]